MAHTLHSGGAIGSDHQWGIQGADYGVIPYHYYLGEPTPYGNTRISEADAIEGLGKATVAARQMGRIEPNQFIRNHLIIRNWCQVKYAEAVFAITTMLPVGSLLDYGKTALIRQGKGGTGYAIQMAINEGKPVFVFDQERQDWFFHNHDGWRRSFVPTLTENFAGIGTRQINKFGVNAIKSVYCKTFKQC